VFNPQETRNNRIAARLMRLAGIPLSAEEYQRGDDLGIPDAPPALMPAQPEEPYSPERFDAARLLAKLLRATGCYLPTSIEGAEGRGHLIREAMRKVQELRDVRRQGRGSKGGNPLIEQAIARGSSPQIETNFLGSLDATPDRIDAATAALLRGMGLQATN
jgi:hypothetical protein